MKVYSKARNCITSWQYVKRFWWRHLSHNTTYEKFKQYIIAGKDCFFYVK